MERTSRTELKFPVHSDLVPKIEDDISCFLPLDAHIKNNDTGENSYKIRSLYFESPDQHFYREKLAGITERVKLRIRTYFPIGSGNQIFLEIKYKNNIRAKKLRAVLSYLDYKELLAGEYGSLLQKHSTNKVIVLFIHFILKYGARPRLCIDYNRRAYVSPHRSQYMRATLDSNLSFFLSNNLFDKQGFHRSLIDPKYYILELKYQENIPFWMQSLVRKYHLRWSALSKYGIATRRLIS
tara:strand:- start:133 stop:849 length:717 start_codon:yes stop_codon:yes gene_type:complete